MERILSKVHYVRLLDEAELQLLSQMLESVCSKIPSLKFICIDTVCEHLRGTEIGYGERKRIVSQMLMGLLKVANKFGIAIVIVNNMRPGKREFIPGQGD